MLKDSGFHDPSAWGLFWPYRPGSVWLGRSLHLRRPVGVDHNQHCLTVAGSRTGKGTCCIVPNLLEWPESVLVIDPKGENAKLTAAYRRDVLGQAVHVVDPFGAVEGFPSASLNPLELLDPSSNQITEDINTIVDSLVVVADPKAAHWDNGAKTILAGLLAHFISLAPDVATLSFLREQIMRHDLAEDLGPDMLDNPGCNGLARVGGNALMSKGKEPEAFLSSARTNTGWLDSAAMQGVLSSSSFSLADLKARPTSVYLVLPPNLLDQHGRFLRLFVKLALAAMSRDLGGKTRCLFMLDEFYSLGYMSELDKAAGALAGYGVKLWPFVQDIGQLDKLYGKSWQTFVGNAGTVQFFGNTDIETLDFLSQMMGRDDKARPDPAALRHYVRKEQEMLVARRMLCFVQGASPALALRLAPYFQDKQFRGKANT